MDAGKPDLVDVGLGLPQHRLEGGAGFVDAEGLRGPVDKVAQFTIWKFEAVEDCVDDVARMEGAADGVDGIPHADEMDANVAGETVGLLESLHRVQVALLRVEELP